MQHTTRSTIELAGKPPALKAVDNTDWLKTIAIILVAVDHFGYFFVENNEWWSVFGRLAAPSFFFLIGYAQTRIVPFHWIWLGAILTVLDSWNNDWKWVPPNILFNLALIRFARPYVQTLLQNRGWMALAFLICAMLVVLPIAGEIVDYGAEGWLWALFGLCQRMYVDGESALNAHGTVPIPVASAHVKAQDQGIMRLLTCSLAAVAYIWGEQWEYSFAHVRFVAFILGIGVLCLVLCRFHRAVSPIQPPEAVASTLRFIGRHTLEIYAIQLAGSELIINLVHSLAP